MAFSWLGVVGRPNPICLTRQPGINNMPCKTENTQIGEVTYSVTQWPAEKALVIKLRLLALLGPSLAAVIGQDEKEFDSSVIMSAIDSIFSSHSPEQIVTLMKDCMIGIGLPHEDRKFIASDFSTLFSGDELVNSYKVFLFIVKVNYGNLISGHRLGEAVTTAISKM